MKTLLLSLVLVIVSILHVHLNCYTVGNVINPSLWVALIISSAPLDESTATLIDAVLVLGIQSFVTAFVAWYLLKWKNIEIWLISYLICIFPLLFLLDHIQIDNSNSISIFYIKLYGYSDALKLILIFSFTQIIYIMLYRIGRILVSTFQNNHGNKHGGSAGRLL